MIEYKWDIVDNGVFVDTVNGNPDTIIAASVKITASEDGVSASQVFNFKVDSSVQDPFTAFKDVTKTQLLSWIKSSNELGAFEGVELAVKRLLQISKNKQKIVYNTKNLTTEE